MVNIQSVIYPVPGTLLFTFSEGGIMISCDSIKNITATDGFYNTETAQSFHDQGLVKP